MRNIAIITARSGSKGIKDKNIKLLNNKPLMAYSIEAALQSEMFDTVMVSTDSEKYAEIACQYGAEVPFMRSSETSGDTAGSWDTVLEVLKKYQHEEKWFDTVCLLQPTSPLRTADDIVAGYEFFVNKNADAVTGVCKCDYPIQYMMQLDETLSMSEFRIKTKDIPRQLQSAYYRLNGALFIRKIDIADKNISILNSNEFAFVMPRIKSIDIDTIEDFRYAEYLMQRKLDVNPLVIKEEVAK